MTRTPAPPADTTHEIPLWSIGVFLIVAFGGAWLVALPLWLGNGLAEPYAMVCIMVMMFTPALGVLTAVLLTRTPWRVALQQCALWPVTSWTRWTLSMVVAIVAPLVIIGLSIAIAGMTGLAQLDLENFSGMREGLGLPAGNGVPPVAVLVALQLAILPIVAIAPNGFLAFGEEVGWRGWLHTALMSRWGSWPTLLITGVLWGLWHAPVILLGYNFERTDLTGVLFMVLGCTAWAVIFGWIRIQSGSVLTAAVAHGALNGAAGAIFLFLAAGVHPDQAIVGPLGAVVWGIIAVVAVVLAVLRQFTPPTVVSNAPAYVSSPQVAD